MRELRVSGAALLLEGQTCTFPIDDSPFARSGFVICYQGRVYAYLNECPHWSVELDLGDAHFYDRELDRIYCKNHGALFVLPTGACETGPCLGRALTQFPAQIDGNDVVVSV